MSSRSYDWARDEGPTAWEKNFGYRHEPDIEGMLLGYMQLVGAHSVALTRKAYFKGCKQILISARPFIIWSRDISHTRVQADACGSRKLDALPACTHFSMLIFNVQLCYYTILRGLNLNIKLSTATRDSVLCLPCFTVYYAFCSTVLRFTFKLKLLMIMNQHAHRNKSYTCIISIFYLPNFLTCGFVSVPNASPIPKLKRAQLSIS